jgi:IclR family transcriptional regulator, acetate operon repressor
MQNQPPQKKPMYPIEAVDNALRLLQLLRDGGKLRLKEAAAELGVAPSTAHRLLAMLVYPEWP